MGVSRQLLVVSGVAAALAGCGGWKQDEVIGTGPASLVFSNAGDRPISIRATWQAEDGEWLTRSFTAYVCGRVELRLADQLQYFLRLESYCDCEEDCAVGAADAREQDNVIVLGLGEPAERRQPTGNRRQEWENFGRDKPRP